MPQNTNRNRQMCCLAAHQKHTQLFHTASQYFLHFEALKVSIFKKKKMYTCTFKGKNTPQDMKQRVHEPDPQ
jgi:hypothetical protein